MGTEVNRRQARRNVQNRKDRIHTARNIAIAIGISSGVLLGAHEESRSNSTNSSFNEVAAVNLFYPELAQIRPKDKGTFTTLEGNIFRWSNFSDAKFNPEAAGQIISFLESIANNALGGSLPLNTGEVVNFEARPAPHPHTTEIFIVTDGIPNPSWGGKLINGGTFRGYSPGLNLSTVRVTDNYFGEDLFRTKEEYANFSFVTEACQTAFNVVASNPTYTRVAQEMQCSSIARGITAVLEGYKFQDYSRTSQGKGSVLPTGEVVPQLVVDSLQYADLVSQLGNVPKVISAE